MRLETSIVDLKNKRPFEEKNWIEEAKKNEKPEHHGNLVLCLNKFHFALENEDFTLWNGKERKYIPLMGIGHNLKNDPEEFEQSFAEKKEKFIEKNADILSHLSLLELTNEQLADLIVPYFINYKNAQPANKFLYIEGDIEDGKITNASVSNYFYTRNQTGRLSLLTCHYYRETSENVSFSDLLSELQEQTNELFEADADFGFRY